MTIHKGNTDSTHAQFFHLKFAGHLLICRSSLEMSLNGLNQVTCRMRDAGARAIDRLDTRLIESLVVLRGNDSTTHNEDVTSAKRLQLINHLKYTIIIVIQHTQKLGRVIYDIVKIVISVVSTHVTHSRGKCSSFCTNVWNLYPR